MQRGRDGGASRARDGASRACTGMCAFWRVLNGSLFCTMRPYEAQNPKEDFSEKRSLLSIRNQSLLELQLMHVAVEAILAQ